MTDGSDRVLVVRATSKIGSTELEPVVEEAARAARRLYFEGYDTVSWEVKCVVLRNDRPVKPTADVGLFAGELRERK